jgi:membrane protein YdbS with pleckstrin-like domain
MNLAAGGEGIGEAVVLVARFFALIARIWFATTASSVAGIALVVIVAVLLIVAIHRWRTKK